MYESDRPSFRWFKGGLTNLGYNCLDYQVQRGRGDHVALIALDELGRSVRYSYSTLLKDVREVTAGLRALGVKRGDRVAIYMPTIYEAIVAMLDIVRMGAIHVVVFAGFGSSALADRINLAGAERSCAES